MDKYVLKMRQAMPLEDKIAFTTRRIHEWVDAFGLGYIYIVQWWKGQHGAVTLD